MHPLLEIEAIGLKSVSNLFEFIFQNIWCFQKGCLPLHPLLEIGATSLNNDLDLVENNFKNIWSIQKKVLPLHPLLKISNYLQLATTIF